MSGRSVYIVDPDLERYRSLLYDLPEGERPDPRWFQHGESPSGEWPNPPVYIDNFAAPSPDVWYLWSSRLVFTPSVVERLEPFISLAGRLLPLANNTGEDWELDALRILNVLETNACMDLAYRRDERERLRHEDVELAGEELGEQLLRSYRETDDPYPYLPPAFIADALGDEPTFFRVERLKSMTFVLELESEPDTLLRRIDRLGITGLLFQKVWSSETGPEEVNLFRR